MVSVYRPVRFLAVAAGTAVVWGCASINPASDYERAGRHVTEVTGQDQFYQPDEDREVDARVGDLLRGGLTLAEAVQVCLLNNPSFQAAWMEIGMARADLVQSGLLSNPSLGGSLRLPAAGGLANLEVTVAQNVADLWQIPARTQVANAALDQAILELARRASTLAAETQAAYWRAVGNRQLHRIANENLKIVRQLLDLALARQQAGAGSEVDVNLSRSALLEAQLTLESARLAAADASRSLGKLLGLTEDVDGLVLCDAFPDHAAAEMSPEGLIELAESKRPDIRAAKYGVDRADAMVRQQWAEVFPSVDVGMAMERAERKRQPGRDILADTARASIANGTLTAPEIQPRSERRTNTDLIIGPSFDLELPIFDQNQAQIARAEFSYRQAFKTLETIQRAMSQDIRQAVDQMRTAWRIADFYRQRFIPLAQRSLDLSRESYKAGRASFLAVLEAQRFYLDTRRRSVEALRTAVTTFSELERAVGAPMSEIRRSLQTEEPGPVASEPVVGASP